MKELIEALLRAEATTLVKARLVESNLIEAGQKHAKVDLGRLREILRLVRMVIGPYSEEEKADAKAELDELAALTGAAPAEGESMVERAARAAIMKARAAGEFQGEGPEEIRGPAKAAAPEAPVAPEEPVAPVVQQASPEPEPAPVKPAAAVAAKGAAAAKAKAAVEKATGRNVTVTIAEAADLTIKQEGAQWVVYSADGRKIGSFATEAEAKAAVAKAKTMPVALAKALPNKALVAAMAETGDSCLIEAVEPTGKVIDVLVIRAGTSANGKRYRPAVLREAVEQGKFEGARSFASEGVDHYGARGVKALVGWWDNARYSDRVQLPNGKLAEGVSAYYHPTDRNLRETLVEAIHGGRHDLIGFSIFGDGPLTAVRDGKRTIQDVGAINVIDSIDPVMHPAAGGQALRLVASMETPVGDENKTPESPDVDKLVEAAVASAMAPIQTERLVEATLAQYPDLAVAAKARVRKLAEGQALTPESAKALVEAEAEYVAGFAPAKITGAGSSVITPGQSQREKLVESISDVLDGKTSSIKKVYIDLTGDEGMTGKTQTSGRLSESRLAEAGEILSTTFPKLTQEAMHKRLIAEYNLPGLDNWKKICSGITSANDFRTQKFVLQGGYGNLPTVLEAAPYVDQAAPAEDDVTFPALHKVGGTEALTLEAIANDDVRVFRRIPVSLARAAKRTLNRGVWSVLTSNPNFPDTAGTALFLAGKNNLGSAAMDATSIAAGRLAMQRQTQLTSGERLGIMPKYLVIPADLEQAEYVLLNTQRVVGSDYNDVSFVAQMGLEPIVVDFWTDANNWYLVADPKQIDTLEVAFFQGRQEPELFVQDEPTNGANFTNDVLTYKIRHIWAVGIVDYRGFYGAIVA